jgi:hypothetical protein
MVKRYFLDSDDDGHWFVIPTSSRKAWEMWRNLPDTDENSWNTPDYAQPVGGSPSALVTFAYPVIA